MADTKAVELSADELVLIQRALNQYQAWLEEQKEGWAEDQMLPVLQEIEECGQIVDKLEPIKESLV